MCRFRLREAGSGWGRNDTLRRFVIPAHDFSDGVLLIPRYRAIQYLGARRVNVRSADGNSGRNMPPELLAHTSPLCWAHVCLTGEYLWPNGEKLRVSFRASRNRPQMWRCGEDRR
ncbi:hypothetical protein ALO82_200210 [Pseudomonas syringae pv. broussonetiae]|uniref:Transposase n=1 Tax=Pseudomonas savastanoi TaxID=29438 RepID=A0A3M5JXK6_PSESS|nr:hypothetical protein ALO82_200210 [Pseudomonas syringae pv. broussonetiae]RMS23077.1 hypothetical protein ALP70_200220 [Pseudomonas savastanoi]RMT27924.1 hypothetical protein ALP51_200173 [Pseudomonas savastanoi]